MKRLASHYLLFHKDRLSPSQASIIQAAAPTLSPLSPKEIKEILTDPTLIRPSNTPNLQPSYWGTPVPSTLGGFRKCTVEISDTGQLLRIFPFAREIESTEWHPGLLWLDKICRP